ncbi:MAG: hypothetical protein ACXAB4_08785 [Candidatus Hodarchaeales archaeon]
MQHFTIKYPTKKQVAIWNLRRTQLTKDHRIVGKEMAKQLDISPGAVSQFLTEANNRIRAILENAARMNKIRLDLLSPEVGFARGKSLIFKTQTYITYSPVNAVQVWYDHKGDCEGCEEFGDCRRGILQEFKERDLNVPNAALRPTDMVELLVRELEGMVNDRL